MVIQSQPPKVVVLSDDLTGAAAAAGESARAGATTEIVCWDRMPCSTSAQALIVDTNSRLLSSAEAAERVRTCTVAALSVFGSNTLMYKRMDTLLRGNTQAEIADWHEVLRRPVLLAAAAPSFGITTENGIQKIRGKQLEVTASGADGTGTHPYQLLDCEGPTSAGESYLEKVGQVLVILGTLDSVSASYGIAPHFPCQWESWRVGRPQNLRG